MQRSQAYATHYKVGNWAHNDVYWHPATGFSWEMDFSYLVQFYKSELLQEVQWFPTPVELIRDMGESGSQLRKVVADATRFLRDLGCTELWPVWKLLTKEDIERCVCGECGNEWTCERYEELRPIDASIGWCPSCGDDGDVGVEGWVA